MQVEISKLRRISNQLFDYLEESGHRTVTIDADYYWVISKSDLYNPYKDPDDFSLGQLSADKEMLDDIDEGKLV